MFRMDVAISLTLRLLIQFIANGRKSSSEFIILIILLFGSISELFHVSSNAEVSFNFIIT